jgi:signal transduction histidine kinase
MFILAHGGKINIESEVNKGTTILVTLPRKRDIKRRFKFSHI